MRPAGVLVWAHARKFSRQLCRVTVKVVRSLPRLCGAAALIGLGVTLAYIGWEAALQPDDVMLTRAVENVAQPSAEHERKIVLMMFAAGVCMTMAGLASFHAWWDRLVGTSATSIQPPSGG